MTASRVVITGVGVVSSLGLGARATMARILRGERSFSTLSLFSPEGYATSIVAEAHLPSTGLSDLSSRSDRLAALAAQEALAQAQVDPCHASMGLIVSASTGGMYETEELLTDLYNSREVPVDKSLLVHHPISSPADHIAALCGPFSNTTTLCSACSGGAVALGLAAMRLRRNAIGPILAGGVDALSRLTFAGFSALGSLDPMPCRPFDRARRGLTLGEGAAFFVLEREDFARARGARIVGELAGFAVACEAHHITHPEPDGHTAERVMRQALEDAAVEPHHLGYISAHGTGTPLNDAMEAAAIARVLGDAAPNVFVSSQKGQLGHTLAAAGSIEAAITLLAMEQERIPPTAGLTEAEPSPPLRLACAEPWGEAARLSFHTALSNSFGFGGTDASVVLTRPGLHPLPSRLPQAHADTRMVICAVATLGSLGRLHAHHASAYALSRCDTLHDREPQDPWPYLDPNASRRLDLASRYAVYLAQEALAQCEAPRRDRIGLIAGSAYGSPEASALFLSRIRAKGPRFAAPAEFPNLVPSSAGAHAAILNGLRGPALSVADLSTTPLHVFAVAEDFLKSNRADAIVALSAEAPSSLVERVIAPACSVLAEGPRGAGGASFVLMLEPAAVAHRNRMMAAVEAVAVWRTPGGSAPVSLRPPHSTRAEVIAVSADAPLHTLLDSLGWRDAPLHTIAPVAGWHEAASGLALAAGAARISQGLVDEVLVPQWAPGRAGAALLVRV